MNILVINGANLNMLEYRGSEYGNISYNDLVLEVTNYFSNDNIVFFQSNCEGEIIDKIHSLIDSDFDCLIINPGAYSHYSYAIYDALLFIPKLKIEVHLSDVLGRDGFRKNLVTASACDKVFYGKYVNSYIEAIEWVKDNYEI